MDKDTVEREIAVVCFMIHSTRLLRDKRIREETSEMYHATLRQVYSAEETKYQRQLDKLTEQWRALQ